MINITHTQFSYENVAVTLEQPSGGQSSYSNTSETINPWTGCLQCQECDVFAAPRLHGSPSLSKNVFITKAEEEAHRTRVFRVPQIWTSGFLCWNSLKLCLQQPELTLGQGDGGVDGDGEREFSIRVSCRETDDGGLSQEVTDPLLHRSQDDRNRRGVSGCALYGCPGLGHFPADFSLHVRPLLFHLGQLPRTGGHSVHLFQDVHPRFILRHVSDSGIEVVN